MNLTCAYVVTCRAQAVEAQDGFFEAVNCFIDPATSYSLHRLIPTAFVAARSYHRAVLEQLANSTIQSVAPDHLFFADELPRAPLDGPGNCRALTLDISAGLKK